jgi:hypothetical protein
MKKNMYVILTEKVKSTGVPEGRVYYSSFHGMFCSRAHADRFTCFEATQPTVQELRRHAPFLFINAIEVTV